MAAALAACTAPKLDVAALTTGAQQYCKEYNTSLKLPTPAECRALALLPADAAVKCLFPFYSMCS